MPFASIYQTHSLSEAAILEKAVSKLLLYHKSSLHISREFLFVQAQINELLGCQLLSVRCTFFWWKHRRHEMTQLAAFDTASSLMLVWCVRGLILTFTNFILNY